MKESLSHLKTPEAWLSELWNRIPSYIRLTFASAVILGLATHLYVFTNKLCSIFGSSTPSLTTANRCNSRSSIFSGRWQSLAVAGVCNTFATLNKGLKINFQRGKENPRHGHKSH